VATDHAVQAYIDAIAPEQRPLFDRLHGLVLEMRPDAEVVISYQIPTYKVGRLGEGRPRLSPHQLLNVLAFTKETI
jgi:hypothetical protein